MQKWRKTLIAGLVAGSAALAALPAAAGTYSPWVDHRQAVQEQKLYNGLVSGRLTAAEYNRLALRQAQVQAVEAAMKADGHFTHGERVRLHKMLNHNGAKIYRAKHNARRQ